MKIMAQDYSTGEDYSKNSTLAQSLKLRYTWLETIRYHTTILHGRITIQPAPTTYKIVIDL